MKNITYCFQRNNIWYFRKKIKAGILFGKKKSFIYKISLKNVLSSLSYHKALLNNTIIPISFYLNNCIEIYIFSSNRNITLDELNQFVKNILHRYEDNAFIRDNNYTNNIGTRINEIEDMRY